MGRRRVDRWGGEWKAGEESDGWVGGEWKNGRDGEEESRRMVGMGRRVEGWGGVERWGGVWKGGEKSEGWGGGEWKDGEESGRLGRRVMDGEEESGRMGEMGRRRVEGW